MTSPDVVPALVWGGTSFGAFYPLWLRQGGNIGQSSLIAYNADGPRGAPWPARFFDAVRAPGGRKVGNNPLIHWRQMAKFLRVGPLERVLSCRP